MRRAAAAVWDSTKYQSPAAGMVSARIQRIPEHHLFAYEALLMLQKPV
jgi:hypothetical protein